MTVIRIALLTTAILCLRSHCAGLQAQPVLYEHPDASGIVPRTEVFDTGMEVDLYYPPNRGGTAAFPVVVFALAFPDTTEIGPFRDLAVSVVGTTRRR